MDVKNYRMNHIRAAETQYLGQNVYKDGAELPVGATVPSPVQTTPTPAQNKRNAYVRIVEQPASKALRFRYECEGRSAGSIPGASSTPENKTFPSIQVVGYKGRALVVVSCVSKDKPYRPHPHNLVGKDGCTKGVCTAKIEEANDMTITFNNLGVQCVKKKDIKQSLKQREDINVDPFRTGFSHANEISSIDLNAVRLCFQVILEGDSRGKFNVPLRPVVSEPIYDKKATSDLVICELSQCTASVIGGQKIILLCEKVNKEDITVRFYEERDGIICWEGFGLFQFNNVHKQTAISFRTPEYRKLDIDKPVKTFIQLRRPSDGASSEALPFQFLPLNSDGNQPASKKPRLATEPGQLLKRLQNDENNLNIQNKENNKLNIPVDVPSSNHHHQHATPEPLNLGRNEALGQSSFYQECHMPGVPYRYPTPYDITPYHRYHVTAAPYTPSIYPGNPYPWHNTTATLDNDNKEKHPELYSNHNQNQHYNTYQPTPRDNTTTDPNQDYRYLAGRYHQDFMKREAETQMTFYQNHQMDNSKKDLSSCYDKTFPVRTEPARLESTYFVNDNAEDVPKISKLLHNHMLLSQKTTNAKRTGCIAGEFKAIPIPVSNACRPEEAFNVDSQHLAQLNSTDLTGLSGLLEPYCTPETKLATEKLADEHENMTDSFSRMSTSEIGGDMTVADVNDFIM